MGSGGNGMLPLSHLPLPPSLSLSLSSSCTCNISFPLTPPPSHSPALSLSLLLTPTPSQSLPLPPSPSRSRSLLPLLFSVPLTLILSTLPVYQFCHVYHDWISVNFCHFLSLCIICDFIWHKSSTIGSPNSCSPAPSLSLPLSCMSDLSSTRFYMRWPFLLLNQFLCVMKAFAQHNSPWSPSYPRAKYPFQKQLFV